SFTDQGGVERAGLLVRECADRVVREADGIVPALAPDECEDAKAKQVSVSSGVVELAVVFVRVEQAEQAPLHANGTDPLHLADPLRALPGPRAERVGVEPDGLHARGCTPARPGTSPGPTS